MSTVKRLISGSAASWIVIIINMTSQMVLVPIYLNYWDVETYGVWLAVQGLMTVLSMLDLGHQNFLGYEFLRLGQNNILALSKCMWSGVVIGILISLVQIILILIIFFSGVLTILLGESNTTDVALLHSAGLALLLQGLTWLVGVSVTGLLTRALTSFGYFPRIAWWAVLAAVVTALAPILAVVNGADLFITSVVLAIAMVGYSIPLYYDIFRLLRKERIKLIKPSLSVGYSNFKKSIPLLGKSLFENVRQQGVRLILAPLSGPVGLVAFSTMRTGANVALQGLNTIVHPLLPDLMRFLHNRDQARSEAAFATIWILVIGLIAPGIVILQTFVEPLYTLWTQGKVTFDPLLFAFLSLGVLVYAIVQPAVAVVMGNNLTKTQLSMAAIAAIIVFGALFILVPIIGIIGAAIALFLAEIVAGIGYKIYAKRWLTENDLTWPKRAFYHAVLSLLIAAVSLAGMVWFQQYKWIILAISMLLFAWNLWGYVMILPEVAKLSAKNIIYKVPGIERVRKIVRKIKLKKLMSV